MDVQFAKEGEKAVIMQAQVEMNVFETILARRSVRSYTSQKVDSGTIRTLLEAAVRAPTAMHAEPWAFFVTQDRQVLQDLSDQAKPLFIEQIERSGHHAGMMADAAFNIFYDAGSLIVICGRMSGPFVAADCWLAAENLMLAACAMGLGTCVIGAALPALALPDVKKKLGIPEEYAAIAPVVVGYSAGSTVPTARKIPLILTKH